MIQNFNKTESWLMNCPVCSAVNDNLAKYCKECSNRFENLDPIGIIQSEGELFRKLNTGRPKLIVLLGTWVMFFPLSVIGISIAVSQALYDTGTSGFIFFWFGVLGFAIGSYFLYNVTRNYFKMKKNSNKVEI